MKTTKQLAVCLVAAAAAVHVTAAQELRQAVAITGTITDSDLLVGTLKITAPTVK